MGARTPQETRRRPRMLAPFVKQRLVSAHQSCVCCVCERQSVKPPESGREAEKTEKRNVWMQPADPAHICLHINTGGAV